MAEVTHLERDEAPAAELSTRHTQQMIYAISHDLLGATRHVKSYGKLLESRLGDGIDAEARSYLARIDEAADTLRIKLEALTTLSRVNTRGEPPSPQSLESITEAAIAETRGIATAAWATVGAEVSGWVIADRAQLTALLVELITNSVKFCERPASIVIRSEMSGDRRIVSVTDSGPGFKSPAPNVAFELFRRFHRADHPGVGAGLTVVRAILDRHGSSATIESSSGKGTTVRFELTPAQGTAGVDA
ncbi:MAG: hypothetical protein HKN24_00035 [Acidimicrobiales bacterium]|nr:hypothetical protein [Acidimicrobiales bacterium]